MDLRYYLKKIHMRFYKKDNSYGFKLFCEKYVESVRKMREKKILIIVPGKIIKVEVTKGPEDFTISYDNDNDLLLIESTSESITIPQKSSYDHIYVKKSL